MKKSNTFQPILNTYSIAFSIQLKMWFICYWLHTFKERVHSEMKISSFIWLTLLIMPIVLIFFRPISLACRRGYGKVMQVRMAWGWCDAGPWMVWCRSGCSDAGPRMFWCRSTDGAMQVHGWFDAGPRMVWCRSMDGVMQVHRWCNAGPRVCKFQRRKHSRGK